MPSPWQVVIHSFGLNLVCHFLRSPVPPVSIQIAPNNFLHVLPPISHQSPVLQLQFYIFANQCHGRGHDRTTTTSDVLRHLHSLWQHPPFLLTRLETLSVSFSTHIVQIICLSAPYSFTPSAAVSSEVSLQCKRTGLIQDWLTILLQSKDKANQDFNFFQALPILALTTSDTSPK